MDKRRGAWVCVGKEEGLPDLAGQPGSSQAGCFLPWLTPHPGAGPRQGSEEGQGVGSTTCCRKISAGDKRSSRVSRVRWGVCVCLGYLADSQVPQTPTSEFPDPVLITLKSPYHRSP